MFFLLGPETLSFQSALHVQERYIGLCNFIHYPVGQNSPNQPIFKISKKIELSVQFLYSPSPFTTDALR